MALVLFVEAALLRSFMDLPSVNIHLHDTTFEVGVAHLEGLAIVLSLLTLWLRERERRHGTRGIVYAGLVLVTVGSEVFCGGQLLLGSRGMPKGYVRYIPQFETLHVVVAIAATVLLVGLAITVSAVKRVHWESATAAVDVFD
jgi:heme/copper-type cytochrome/quinol oxidase subunit 1